MAYKTFVIPRTTYYGQGALESINELSAKRALIVTDPGIRKLGLIERVEDILKKNNIATSVFEDVEPDPSKKTVWTIFDQAQEFKPDLFIGLGGGSSMDAAKTAWILYEHPDLAELSFLEFLGVAGSKVLRNKARLIAIATTSGTGSEATRFAVVTNREVMPPIKLGYASNHVLPDIAIVDSELAALMPPSITANTGFDALIHAIECFTYFPGSEMVDMYSIKAAELVMEYLPKAVENGKDMVARDNMHLASYQAGVAISNGGTLLVHETAHSIGSLFHIPHGMANALMLCPVFAFTYPARKARLAQLANALRISGKDERETVTKLLDTLNALKKQIGIPMAIKETGVDETEFFKQLDAISNQIMQRMLSRPPVANMTEEQRRARGLPGNVDDLKELFTHAWNGSFAELK